MLTRYHFHLSYLFPPSVCSSSPSSLFSALHIPHTPHSLPQKQIKPKILHIIQKFLSPAEESPRALYPVTGHCLRRLLPFVARPKPRNCPPSFLCLSCFPLSLFFPFFLIFFYNISLYVSLFPTHSVSIRLPCNFPPFLILTRTNCAVLDRSNIQSLPRSIAAAGSRLARAPARFSRSSLSYSRHHRFSSL